MQILEAIKNLNVVSISLVHGEDDPQLIFESINSTGVPLSKSDLIRNFLLMNDLHQDRLFGQYWIPLENKLRTKNSNAVFDTFFRQFLITKNNKPVNQNNVYENFIETFDKENYTKEHIMPQTLNASWKINITDEDHSKYISTLGNLSLTGYNSEMSNKEKQKILGQNSKVKILNEDVLNKKSWSIKDIEVRGNRLANILVNRYQVQKVNDPLIKFELTDTLTLDKPELATGRKPISFTLEGITYKRKTFKDILLSVVKLLDQEKPEILESLVGLIYSGKTNDEASKQLVRKSNSSECELIRDGYYIYTSLSAFNIFRLISLLFDKYGINKNKFSILVKKEK